MTENSPLDLTEKITGNISKNSFSEDGNIISVQRAED